MQMTIVQIKNEIWPEAECMESLAAVDREKWLQPIYEEQ